jgi:hypothetical protein
MQGPYLITYESLRHDDRKSFTRHNYGQQFVSLPTKTNGSSLLGTGVGRKKARSLYFDLSALRATRIYCNGQGLTYSFPSDRVQLRRISGRFNEFSLSHE